MEPGGTAKKITYFVHMNIVIYTSTKWRKTMLDIKRIRENFEEVATALGNRGVDRATVEVT